MNAGDNKISSPQLMLLIAGFIMGSSLLISFMDSIAKQEAWLVIVFAFVVSVPFILSYVFLAKRFPGKNIIEIIDILYGPYLGKPISILYIGYFFHLFSLNVRVLGEFYAGSVMPEMPMLLLLAVFVVICAYAVQRGIETIARISLIAVVFSVITVVFTSVLLLGNIDLSNFLPVLQLSAKDYVQSTHIFAAIPFCEIAVFLMVFPTLNKVKQTGKSAVGGFVIGAVTLLVISVRNTAVLGPSAGIAANAAYSAGRLIDVGEVLTRIELLIAFGITIAMFIKISVLFYATATSIGQLFRVRSVSPLIIPLGIIAAVTALIMFDSTVEHQISATSYHPIYALLFEFIIPPLSLLIAKIRKLPEKTGA